ncbi:MAG: hypothetical protein JSU70_21255 [Phycisphaerales bacterium]|nr:MAG: hypothetical protein JSU70_21255 [Phycisphaerales bacterium]
MRSEEKRGVLPLTEIMESDREAVGSKAYGLARMSQLGLPVPSGFCITTPHYWSHVHDIEGFNDMIAALPDCPAESAQILSDIRQAILDKPLLGDLSELIRTFHESLGTKAVAVRSSATAEDLAEHSFAGQYETYLGIETVEECCKAVKKCWASLWSQRAYDYRQSAQVEGHDIGMAVIVQQMVEADASGVLFTADPVTNDADRLMIEVCYGLGDALVSGRVTPDRFVVDKTTGTVASQTLSEQMRADTGPRDAEKVTQNACIDSATIRKLTGLAVTIEKHYQCPQDIEWALCGSDIYILQSRPITTTQRKLRWEDRQVWTCVNTREVMPDVLTPCTWSLVSDLLHSVLDMVLDMIGLDRGANPVVGLIAGRCYGNLNTLVGIARKVPIMRKAKLSVTFGDTVPGEESGKWLALATEQCAEIKCHRVKALLRLPANLFHAITFTNRKGMRVMAGLQGSIDEFGELDVRSLSDAEIVGRVRQSVDRLMQFIYQGRHGAIHGFTHVASFTLLRKACVRWLKESDAFANGLLVGIGDMVDANAGLDLWRLASKGAANPEIKSIIMSQENWDKISEKVAAADDGNRFMEAWTDFMQTHGHHTRGEFELYNARWRECPDYVLSVIRSYISGMEEKDIVATWQQRAEKRRQLVRDCRKRLRNPVKRAIFNSLLKRSQGFVALREKGKNDLVQLIASWRRMLLSLGERLRDQGVLKEKDDIFFLELPEIHAIVDGSYAGDVLNQVRARKAEYESHRTITPPITVQGRYKGETSMPDLSDTAKELLTGLAVSPGMARGKAKVIRGADDESQVLPGEILVAPFTDPGWTPYLVAAAGIVVDQGGLLSHGSIIAREYGIPTVVNVGAATQVIKTGDEIEVNGDQGTVRILGT